MKKYLISIVIIICCFINISNIFAAHQCQYSLSSDKKKNDFTITYNDDKTVSVDSKKWYDSGIVQNTVKGFTSFLLIDYDDLDKSSSLLSNSVEKALSEDSCPGLDDEVYVCTGFSFAIEPLNPAASAVETVVDLFHPIWTKGVTFSSYLETIVDDIASIAAFTDVKNSLIVAGSERDAKETYGYFDGKGLDLNWNGIYKAEEDFDLGYRFGSMDCNRVYYTGDKTTFNLNCPYLSNIMSSYTSSLDKYKECDKSSDKCRYNLSEADENENKLKQYCSSILSNQDYYLTEEDAKNENANECMIECLSIYEKINELKKDAGINVSDNGKCGFSDKLLAWIYNIVKWIKYIIPSIVILLGILDFIKAIASDKDDEMKKAQGRFVKRLIAAALIFIVPFIIEFILDKFGFIDKSCISIEEII